MKKLLLVSAAVVALAPSVSFAAFSEDTMTTTCAAGGCALALADAISAATTQTEIKSIVDFALGAGLSTEELAAVLATALSVLPATSPVAAYINQQVALLNLTLPAVASGAEPITAS